MAKESKPQGAKSSQPKEEKRMKIRVKDFLTLHGRDYPAGNILELPEREALGVIGQGKAEQIPPGESAQSETGTPEQVAEATHRAGIPEQEDKEKAKQLEQYPQEAPERPEE